MDIVALKRDPLPKGYQIRDREIIGELGGGGFGITYRTKHKLLNKVSAIKEFFPIGCVRDLRGEIIPAPRIRLTE
jgi:hypothetical protein